MQYTITYIHVVVVAWTQTKANLLCRYIKRIGVSQSPHSWLPSAILVFILISKLADNSRVLLCKLENQNWTFAS